MDITVESKISVFSGLGFAEAASIVVNLCRQLTQEPTDIYAHIVKTLPMLTENDLDKQVLNDIYRAIVVANEAVTVEEREHALQHLQTHHKNLEHLFEKEKQERTKEIQDLDTKFSIL